MAVEEHEAHFDGFEKLHASLGQRGEKVDDVVVGDQRVGQFDECPCQPFIPLFHRQSIPSVNVAPIGSSILRLPDAPVGPHFATAFADLETYQVHCGDGSPVVEP